MNIPEIKAALEKRRDMRSQDDLLPIVLMLAEALSEIQVKCEVTGRAYPIARKALEQLYAMVGK